MTHVIALLVLITMVKVWKERDVKKEIYYLELAAMGGHVKARHNLGILEMQAIWIGGLSSSAFQRANTLSF